jgi:hypothetical protein
MGQVNLCSQKICGFFNRAYRYMEKLFHIFQPGSPFQHCHAIDKKLKKLLKSL